MYICGSPVKQLEFETGDFSAFLCDWYVWTITEEKILYGNL